MVPQIVRLRRTVAAAATSLLVCLPIGACTVTTQSGSDQPNDAGSGTTTTTATKPTGPVHDNKAVLDFTKRPTREAFGLPEGRQFVSVDRTGTRDIDVTMKLPTGELQVGAFDVSVATNASGGADDAVTSHVPKYFNVLADFDSAEAAVAKVASQAKVLGVDETELRRVGAELGDGDGQSRTLRGLIQDWLAVEVVLTVTDDGMQVDYQVDVDTYHNQAVDQIVKDGKVDLDLTRRPSRAALGFLDTYRDADVLALPGQTLALTGTTGTGTLRLALDSMSSGSGPADDADRDPQGTQEPSFSLLRRTASNDDIEKAIADNADLLGIDAGALTDLFSGSAPTTKSFGPTDLGGGVSATTEITAAPARKDAYAAGFKIRLSYS